MLQNFNFWPSSIGGSDGGARDTPFSVQFLLFSCSFRQTFCKLIGWRSQSGRPWICHCVRNGTIFSFIICENTCSVSFMRKLKFHFCIMLSFIGFCLYHHYLHLVQLCAPSPPPLHTESSKRSRNLRSFLFGTHWRWFRWQPCCKGKNACLKRYRFLCTISCSASRRMFVYIKTAPLMFADIKYLHTFAGGYDKTNSRPQHLVVCSEHINYGDLWKLYPKALYRCCTV